MVITSFSNARVRKVEQWVHKARARREDGVFVAEGVKMFGEAPEERIRQVFVSESFLHAHPDGEIRKKLDRCGFDVASDGVFAKMADTETPQGILCVLERYDYRLEDALRRENPLLLLLEEISDPGNLGTMLRAGEGAGIDGVVMSRETADVYNPKAVRATMGSVYRVPFVYVDSLAGAAGVLKAKGIVLYAAHLGGKAPYDQCSYQGGSAFLIGNEANGLRKETAALADIPVVIPMEGRVESLNAATAAAVLMFEAARQRRSRVLRDTPGGGGLVDRK